MAQNQPIALEIPTGLSLPDLQSVLNDRLRTIALMLANQSQPVQQSAANQTIVQKTTTTQVIQTSSVDEGYFNVSVALGVASPNLSQGRTQRVLLTQHTTIVAPPAVATPRRWTMIIDQDNVGGWMVTLDASYYGDLSGLIKTPNTRSQINWTLDPLGNHSINSIITGAARP